MLNKLLFKLSGLLRVRLIDVAGQPYLERYYLGKFLGITFYLHRFVREDAERHVHNHPWTHSGSVVLTGWYMEERVIDLCPQLDDGVLLETRRISWINTIRGNTFHRIAALRKGTWTLFFHGARQEVGHAYKWVRGEKVREPILKGWGFLKRYGDSHNGNLATVFEPFPPGYNLDWHLTAPHGAESTREPL